MCAPKLSHVAHYQPFGGARTLSTFLVVRILSLFRHTGVYIIVFLAVHYNLCVQLGSFYSDPVIWKSIYFSVGGGKLFVEIINLNKYNVDDLFALVYRSKETYLDKIK